MSTKDGSYEELLSWKQIAEYLGVTVRAAQLWERERGLPVRRLPGARGRVSARVEELEAWKESGSTTSIVLQRTSMEITSRGRLRAWIAGAIATVVLCGVVATIWWMRPQKPSGFRVNGKRIEITDDRGRVCWSKEVGNLASNLYRDDRFLTLRDIDGDGRVEALLVPQVENAGPGPVPLICYDETGRERWHYVPARSLKTAREELSSGYHVARFAVFGEGRNTRIAVASVHGLYYPGQVAVLSPQGKLLGEYWHAGQLTQLLVDRHRDRTDLVLAGVSNSHRAATLVVLDADHLGGASAEEDAAYRFVGMPAATERARLLFPRSCFNQRIEPFAVVAHLWQTEEGFTVEVLQHPTGTPGASVFYHLNPDLTLRELGIGSDFEMVHRQKEIEGLIDHRFSEAERERLREIAYLRRPPAA